MDVGARRALLVACLAGLASASAAGTPAAAAKPCAHAKLKPAVERFLVVLNHGIEADIARVLGSRSTFRVYSQAERYGRGTRGFFSSHDRGETIAHLAKRFAKGDRYRLADLDANDYDRSRGLCNVGFVLKRRIAAGPWRPFVGKGALDRASGRIAVWNVGGAAVLGG